MKSVYISFSPALSCVECHEPTNQGLLYPMRSQGWQLLPLCSSHSKEPSTSDDSNSLSALRCRIHEQLAEIQQLQRRKHHLARAYTWLRRQHASSKMRRALRWQLNQAEDMEVLL